ncbi:glycosyl transferase, group 2 family protein [Flavobacterium enshiense DK69]|uniref:Glycosyl transferase family 2 n=1 Tax=Flavobacterium enshiense DK69 TaxID=1107311 RepID=V6S6R5_9FLAO|nr:glycosyltransferase family 2 protein [Flavobacterium enshiense]ESU22336.1 glycosyl transferase, group 2 family protein [Flavobacterium enshiense DK69]KGO97340.1 glycosyl transferase family 2 [Flavobacterium enshiense DK69]
MQLSVIILNYNVRYFLEQCVLSVQKALVGIEGEIIVVDNFSADSSCDMMKLRFPNVRLIENKANLGFPKGNNIGVDEAKGKYICILNPDTVVAEDTFQKVLAFAESKSDLGIVGCKLIDGTGNFLPECKRGTPTPWVAFTKIFGLYKLFPKSGFFNKYYAQHLSENQTGKVDILVGAFMVMKRDLYLEVGGFDENCFMYSDDIDLSYTVLKSGKSNYYFHETSVIHYKGESTVRDGTYMKRFREAMHFFYKKHFGGSFVFDVFMRIGAFLFAILKKQQQQQIVSKPDEYMLFSFNESMKGKLEKQLQKKVSQAADINENALFSQENSKGDRREIVLDNSSFSFKEIIGFLEKNKNKGFTFKIIPDKARFMIGSNSSNDRGEIIVLQNSDLKDS